MLVLLSVCLAFDLCFFNIAATDPSSSRKLPDGWLYALPTGIRIWLPVTSDPSTFPVRCYGCQYLTYES